MLWLFSLVFLIFYLHIYFYFCDSKQWEWSLSPNHFPALVNVSTPLRCFSRLKTEFMHSLIASCMLCLVYITRRPDHCRRKMEEWIWEWERKWRVHKEEWGEQRLQLGYIIQEKNKFKTKRFKICSFCQN